MLDWHGCECRGLRGSGLKPSPVKRESGKEKGLEARNSSELSIDCVLHIKMQLKIVFPWNEQSAKALIRSSHSHHVVCSRILGEDICNLQKKKKKNYFQYYNFYLRKASKQQEPLLFCTVN